MTEQELRVLQVALAQGEAGDDPKRCSLVLQLSRPVDPFEVEALSEHLGITIDHQDRMKAYWPKVDLEEMAKNPAMLSGKVMNAAGFAQSAREEAQRQTSRVGQLIEQINTGLRQ
ncbi:hypothetical protein KXD96_09630 [Mycobacterium sp. SMC-2]|uniref:hypothetical protein n=1 Tax=Mycobacterium sp. SMC-2 TaxID=2857058 RepID=UPI0021B44102|nr:hypothetical protein [Mycobacterium sp. SMC-2]UXA08320.1 hypothetical protein KXD96_09630 [Mycobacterium sp. SMC-2]